MHSENLQSSSPSATAPWARLARGAGLIDPAGNLSSTVFEEMSALAHRHGALNLGQGFPDTDGPEILRTALAEAVASGHNQYATIAGLPELRAQIADHEAAHGRRRPDPDTEVTVTAGATEALSASMLAHLRPGDEVVLFEPFYDLYPAVAALAGATVRTVPLLPPAFLPEPGALEKAFSDRTRMVVLNDPHNPTGTVFPAAVLCEVAELAVAHDALVLTDSVYEHLWFEEAPADLSALPGAAERTIRVSSASKTFSITGWRLGWAVAAPELARGIRATKGYLSHSAAAPVQQALARTLAWAAEQDFYASFRAEYRRQREVLMEGLAGTELQARAPQGTFFAVAELPEGTDGTGWAQRLPQERGVAVIPLSAFCTPEHQDLYASWVRLAFCKRPEVLTEAVRRLGTQAPARATGQDLSGA